jgi:alginate O-acetyltransferase complex protein AlgJ
MPVAAAPRPAQRSAANTKKAAAPKRTTPTRKVATSLLAQGKIQMIARTPRPGAVPYKEAIIAIQLTDVRTLQGKPVKSEILVFMWGMRNNTWTRAASYRVGQTIKLSLQPWEKVENKFGGYNRIDLEGDDIFRLDPYWAESAG